MQEADSATLDETDSAKVKRPCVLEGPRDRYGCYPISSLIYAPDNCTIPAACFGLSVKLLDSHGHEVDEDSPEQFECNHDKSVIGLKKPKSEPVMPQSPPAEIDVADDLSADDANTNIVSVPSTPDNALADVKALIPAGGDASGITVLLAIVGVAGGGAAWKFYSQHSKNKHEQKMRELELQTNSNSNDHQKCNVERAALEAKVAALETRLASAEQAVQDAKLPDLPFDPEDLSDRLEKIEKAIKAFKAKKATR